MASRWEFTNRAMIFGFILNLPFACYIFDHRNTTDLLSQWLSLRYRQNPDLLAHLLLVAAALLLALAALLRTWASAYLKVQIVYASEVKGASLTADGPYRFVRNPLYFANILMAIAFCALLPRSGGIFAVLGMIVFCYRLILREECELGSNLTGQYAAYRKAVPRLWPSMLPQVPRSGQSAGWGAAFKAESWCWGFALGLLIFAITLNLGAYFLVVAASSFLLWLSHRPFKSASPS